MNTVINHTFEARVKGTGFRKGRLEECCKTEPKPVETKGN